jgi:hypothetical protein
MSRYTFLERIHSHVLHLFQSGYATFLNHIHAGIETINAPIPTITPAIGPEKYETLIDPILAVLTKLNPKTFSD